MPSGASFTILGPKAPMCSQTGRRAGSAVEEEPDRPFGFIGDAVLRVVHVEEMAFGDAAGGLLDGHEADARGVVDGLAVQRDLVIVAMAARDNRCAASLRRWCS